MGFLPAAKAWRVGLFVALGFFVVTRAATLGVFPIFNDEAIYLQYAQAMHDDWGTNKFISMNGLYGDWKPPLQYWLAAPLIRCGDDPLLAGRALAAAFSLLGLVGFYLFAKELSGERAAVVTAWLYVLCPSVLFNNNQFIAETFLFSTAPFLYWAILRTLRPNERWRWAWALAAMAAGTTLLLFKQSGTLLLWESALLPLAFAGAEGSGRPTSFAVVVLVIVSAHLATKLVLPAEFSATRAHFNSNWVMSAQEVARLPAAVWQTNLKIVSDYTAAYYGWGVPLLFLAALGFGFAKRSAPELALAAMCLVGGGAVTFLLRGFNEYLFNTAVIVALLPLLARAVLHAWENRSGRRALRVPLLAIAGLTLVFWSYQLVLLGISADRYIQRSTPWAVANYLRSWATGFGIQEVIAMLEKEKEPGVIFADTQWGNPRVALEVYQERYPHLRVVAISREFLKPNETRALRDFTRQRWPVRLAVFSADASGEREQWQKNVEAEMCEQRSEIKGVPDQTPIIVCRF